MYLYPQSLKKKKKVWPWELMCLDRNYYKVQVKPAGIWKIFNNKSLEALN